jgi:type I restriction enzyme S subunit
LNRYSTKYKEFTFGLINKIPTHWRILRLKFISSVLMGQSPKSKYYNHDGVGFPFLQGNADFGKLSPSTEIYSDNANKVCLTDSILLSVRAPVGALNIADQPYAIGRGLCAIYPNEELNRNYLWYALHLLRNQLYPLITGSTFEAVSTDEVRNMKVVLPPLNEQKQIASFLDYKTNQIDKLIEKKQKLLELLKEKRTALITKAVTKGINPDAEMKPSGIDWVDKIPKHWETKRLKFLINLNPTYKQQYPEYISASFIPMENLLEYGGLKLDIEKPIEDLRKSYTYFEDGDVIVAKITPCFENGKGTVCENLTNGIGFGTTELHVLRPKEELNNYFLFYLTISDSFRKLGESEMYGAGGQKRVPTDFFRNTFIPIPPKEEQEEIVEFIGDELKSLDQLSDSIKKAINKLSEYRNALITSAVTGQIDLRNWEHNLSSETNQSIKMEELKNY